MIDKKIRIYPGMINFTIELDEKNQISSVQYGNDYPFYRNFGGTKKISDNKKVLKWAFKYMLITDSEDFAKLYKLLKDNDPEMFAFAKEVVDELGSICLNISLIE